MRTRWTLAGLVCLCLVDITIGGAPRNHRETEDGKPCSFPFTVDGETHYDCTKYKWDHEWCATTPNFNKDKKWGNCKPRLSAAAGLVAPHSDPCSPPPNGKGLLAFAGSYNGNCSQWWQPCKIPFTFEGKTYYSCTSDGYRLNLNWCSLVDDWVTGQPWGICHDTKDRNDACPWVEVSGAVKDANTNGYYYRLNDICQTGYTAGTWRKCNLPSSNNDRFIQLSNTQNYLRWSISSSQCRDFPVAYSRDYRLTPPIPTQPYDPSIAPWYEWFNSVEYPNSNLKVTCLNSFEETCLCDRCACVTADSCQCTQSCSGGGSTCIDTFTKTNGMHSLGGKLYDGVTSQLQCESLCLVNDTCMAYDFDRNQQQCFFHIGMGYKSFQAASAGVDQYERNECTTTTGQPTGTTRPGACKDSFQPYPDKHGFGATDDATADTLAKCETACLDNPNCLAYEYDIVSTPSCWIHDNADNIDPLVDTDTQGVFTHYRRVKCTTTPAHPVSTPGGCQDTFDELASRFSFDGTELASANTLDECKQGCREDDNCVGCDWNIASNGCFLHYDKVEFAKKHDSRGAINQYVRKPCGITTGMTARTTGFPTGTGCVDTFHQLEKHNAPGGSRQNGVTTDHDCASECLKSATCVAYDYNWLDDQCYLFFDKVKADKTQYNTDVHHYTRQPCVGGGSTTPPGGCQDEFKEYLQHQTVGGEQYTGTATTVSDCLRACIQSDCYGIDWDQQNSAQPTCWLHRSDKNFLGRKPVNTNINSYELIHRCQDSTAVTGYGTTNVPTTDCPNAWQKMEDTKVNGAEKFPAATTVEQCQKACREQSDCKSIDFNTGSGVYDRCWLHTKEISSNDYQPASGVDHYKHIGCPQLKCIYHLYADTKVVGAEEQPSMALEACQESCTADANCLALDFVPANSGCWLHSNLANLANRQNAAGVNHYVKECMEKCEDDFIGYENYNVQGGEQVSGVANLDACKTACSNNAACVAIDFNTITNSCWMHTDATKIQTRSVASGINHYVIQRCDEGCRSEWELYDNQNVQGGTKASGVNNLDDCKKYCDDMAECLGIDYNINDAGCWTHTDPDKLAARKSMNGVDHLVIKRCSECINNYERYNNTNAIGGTPKKDYMTMILCRNACYNDLNCLGFDYVRRAGTVVVRCWFHYDAVLMANRQHKPEVDHFVVKRCTEECANQYTRAVDKHVSGGTEKPGPATPAECQTLCDAEPSCTSFDFDTRQHLMYATKCYLHFNRDPPLNSMTGVDHYSLTKECTGTTSTTPGGCKDEFLATTNTHSNKGVATPAGLTLDLCQDACVSLPNCMGLDWNPKSSSGCWLHLDRIEPPQPYNGVTQYTIQRCSECKDTFVPHPNMHASGGVYTAGGTTADQCKQLCSQDDQCVAIDWNEDYVAKRCYLHLNSVGQLRPLTGVTHYKITRCTDDCTMVEYKNGRATSGDNVGFYPNNFNQCRMACDSQPLCKSVDWNKSTGACFIHTGTSGFILDSCCKRMVKICGTCIDQFTEIPNKNHVGGQPAGSADELEECKQQCRASPNCESFDFNAQNQPPLPRCYLHNQIITSLLSNSAVSHYQRGFCLPAVGSTQTGMTSTPAMNTPTQYPLDCFADIVFLVDDSGSITDTQGHDTGTNRNPSMWDGVRNFLRTIAANIDIGLNSNRLAVVRYSNTGIVDFRLNQIQTNQYVDTTLANLAFTGGASNTHSGLQTIRTQIFTLSGGDRPHVKNIVVIFTDGKSADSQLLTAEINTMRSIAKVFVVGVTAMINHVGLIHLTSIPSDDHLFLMSDLTTFITRFTNSIMGSCESSDTTTLGTTSFPAPQPFQCNAAFTVARRSSAGPGFPLLFPAPLLNFGSLVAGGRFISPGNCIYYVTLCVGVPGQGKINYGLIRPNGWPAFNVYRTSISHNGNDMLGRDGLISINQNQPLSIKTTDGNIFSDIGLQTAWSAMSLTDASSIGQSYFYCTRISDFSHTGHTVDFTEFDLRSTDNSFDRINSRYRCPATGFYFFSYSVGLKPGQGARVQLKGGSRTVELTRTSTSHNGYDTMSRAVLLQCNVGSFVWLHLEQGLLASNTDRQTSFLGFRYNPFSGQSVAWTAYRTSSFAIGGAANYLKISYTEVAINIGNAFDVSNHRVRIPRKGIYLIHWSVGVQSGNQVDVMLFKNGQPLAAISREATNHNGKDTMSRSLTLEMQFNDMLEIFARKSSTGLYSDAYRQTSFFGILINPL